MRKKQLIVLSIFLSLGLTLYLFRQSFVVNSIASFFQDTISTTRAIIYSSKTNEETSLSEENRKLKEKLSGIELIERENIALRSQFEENSHGVYKLLPANIIGYKGRGVYEAFLIGAGKEQGVRTGTAVVVGSTLVGTIFKTSQNISEVHTILHPDFSTIVKYPKTSARGIIRGYNSYLIMENVLITDTLEKDGIIVTMGELNNAGIGVPSDLNVGKIDSVDREETASFQAAQVTPLIDYSQISTVFVIVGLN